MNDQRQPLLVERQDRVMILTFNRPESLNAFNVRLLEQLVEALKSAENDQDLGVIVMRGVGRAFSAGMDMKQSPEDSV